MSKRLLSEKTSLWVKFTSSSSRDVKKSHQVSQFCAFQRHEFVNALLQMRQNFVWSPPANIKERECIPTLKSSWKKFFKDSQQSRAHLLLSCQGGVYQNINTVLSVPCTFYWEMFNTIEMLGVFRCFINLMKHGSLTTNLSSFWTLISHPFHHLTMSNILTEISKSLWCPFLPPQDDNGEH